MKLLKSISQLHNTADLGIRIEGASVVILYIHDQLTINYERSFAQEHTGTLQSIRYLITLMKTVITRMSLK